MLKTCRKPPDLPGKVSSPSLPIWGWQQKSRASSELAEGGCPPPFPQQQAVAGQELLGKGCPWVPGAGVNVLGRGASTPDGGRE